MDEAELADEDLRAKLAAQVAPAEVIFLDVKTEAELAELPEDEAAEMAAELGMGEPGLNRLAHAGFSALGLMTFLTAGPKEVRGLGDPGRRDGAGGGGRHPHRLPARLHQGGSGGVRRPGGGRIARAAGAAGEVRIEGKDYVMRDATSCDVRSTVPGSIGAVLA